MAWIIDALTKIGSPTEVFTTLDILIVAAFSIILAFIIAETYRRTHIGKSYSQSFVQTLIMFSILVSGVMLIIGSNLAKAFALVGSLSIVRFRNALKETRDVGYVFFMMAIGMAVGTRFYLLAVILTLSVCLLLTLMHRFNYGANKQNDFIIKINYPEKNNPSKQFESVLKGISKSVQILNIESGQNENEITYSVTTNDVERLTKIVNQLKDTNPSIKIVFFKTQAIDY